MLSLNEIVEEEYLWKSIPHNIDAVLYTYLGDVRKDNGGIIVLLHAIYL